MWGPWPPSTTRGQAPSHMVYGPVPGNQRGCQLASLRGRSHRTADLLAAPTWLLTANRHSFGLWMIGTVAAKLAATSVESDQTRVRFITVSISSLSPPAVYSDSSERGRSGDVSSFVTSFISSHFYGVGSRRAAA